ncbi:MAG: Ig-like domain-containing protein [bacterium]|nr:Ig-like domain-containing protein [bacterium]
MVGGVIVFRFSESVDKSSTNDAIMVKKGTETIPGAITYCDADKVATFTPTSALPQGGHL